MLDAVRYLRRTLDVLLERLSMNGLARRISIARLLAALRILIRVLRSFTQVRAVHLARISRRSLRSDLYLVLSTAVKGLTATFTATSAAFTTAKALTYFELSGFEDILVMVRRLARNSNRRLLSSILLISMLGLTISFDRM